MEITALVVGFAFCMHLLMLWIRQMKKNNFYNQNIMFHGGYIAGDGQQGRGDDILYVVDENETVYSQSPRPSVTSSFSEIKIRLYDTGTGICYDYVMEDQLIIGRYFYGNVANIQFQDSMVSQKHCKIYRQGEQIFVQDLGSTNRTFLNGCALERVMPLAYGDTLKIGQGTYQFYCFR